MANSYFIKGGWVVSVDDEIGNQSDCHVLVEDGIIKAVGKDIQAPDSIPVIDASDCIVSPGFVDTHRHAWQSQLKNVTSDMMLPSYFVWLRNVYGSCYTAHDAYIGELMGALESIEAGVTFMIDHSHIMNSPAHSDAVVKALKDSHIRGVFCYGLYINPAWDGVAPETVTETTSPDWRFEDSARVRKEHFSADNGPQDLLRFGFAPAEIERATIEQNVAEIEHGRKLGAAIITGHVSMGKMARGYFFMRNMAEKKLLGPDLLFSHCAALHDDELESAKAAGVGIAVTPETELQMAMGHPLSFKAEKFGCKHGLGIDVACNNPIDMFQQMRLLLQTERNLANINGADRPTKMTYFCKEVLRFATMGGADAVGLKDMIGSITPGKKADLVLTKMTSTRMTPVHDPVAALVLYANASDIDTVLIDGRVVKKGGQLVDFDWAKLRGDVLKSTENILERAKKAPMDDIMDAIQIKR